MSPSGSHISVNIVLDGGIPSIAVDLLGTPSASEKLIHEELGFHLLSVVNLRSRYWAGSKLKDAFASTGGESLTFPIKRCIL